MEIGAVVITQIKSCNLTFAPIFAQILRSGSKRDRQRVSKQETIT